MDFIKIMYPQEGLLLYLPCLVFHCIDRSLHNLLRWPVDIRKKCKQSVPTLKALCLNSLSLIVMSSHLYLPMFVWQIDDLLKRRNEIHASYSNGPPIKRCKSKNRSVSKESKEDGQVKDKKPALRERLKRKKWYNIHLKVDKTKPCWTG